MKNYYKTEHSFIFENSFCNWETGELLSPVQTQNYTIVQVAELYYNNSFYIREHLQRCDLEITLPTTNGLSCATNGKSEKLRKHEAYLSFKNDKHELSSRLGCRFQTFAINFTGEVNKGLLNRLKELFKSNPKRYSPELSHFFTAIIGEFLSPDREFFHQSLDGLITEILVRLARTQPAEEQEKLSTKTTPELLLNYLDNHFLEVCSLEELSAKFGYTYSHICKIFKAEYSVTPIEYLITKKMEYATLLLSQGKTLSEIAEATGYSTPYNFSRAFKKQFGISPSNFKKTK